MRLGRKIVIMLIIKVTFVLIGAYIGLVTANLVEKLIATPSGVASS